MRRARKVLERYAGVGTSRGGAGRSVSRRLRASKSYAPAWTARRAEPAEALQQRVGPREGSPGAAAGPEEDGGDAVASGRKRRRRPGKGPREPRIQAPPGLRQEAGRTSTDPRGPIIGGQIISFPDKYKLLSPVLW